MLRGVLTFAAESLGSDDLSLLFVLIALVCLAGAGYLAYLRNVLGTVLLVFVALVALWLGT